MNVASTPVTKRFGVPSPMTARARSYMLVACLRNLPIGIAALLDAEIFHTPTFAVIRDVLPMPLWGVAVLSIALVSVLAAATRLEWVARMSLIGGSALTGAWVAGFIASALSKGAPFAFVAVMWGSGIALKDLIVCRQPLYSPFEPLVRRVRQDGTKHVEHAV